MGCLSSVLPIAGTAVGTYFGGPLGGAIGGQLGSLGSRGLDSGKTSGNHGGSGAIQSIFGSDPQLYNKNPAWLDEASQDVYNQAKTATSTPYQAYTGQQVAPLSANQQIASQNAANSVGRFAPTYGAITNYLNNSATPYNQNYKPTAVTPTNVTTQNFNQADIGSYMNPYLQASLQPQIQNLNQQYSQQQNQANAAAAGSGNFGGSRQGVMNALINKQQNQDIQNVTAQGYNTAFNDAANNFQTDQARNLQGQLANQSAGLNAGEFNENANSKAFDTNYGVFKGNQDAARQAATGLNSLVNTQQGVTNSIEKNLMDTGNAAQTTQQAQDTANYQNFLEQRGYPKEQAAYLASILSASPDNKAIGNGNNVVGNNGIANAAGQLGNSGGLSGLFNSLGGGLSGIFGGGGGSGGGISGSGLDSLLGSMGSEL